MKQTDLMLLTNSWSCVIRLWSMPLISNRGNAREKFLTKKVWKKA